MELGAAPSRTLQGQMWGSPRCEDRQPGPQGGGEGGGGIRGGPGRRRASAHGNQQRSGKEAQNEAEEWSRPLPREAAPPTSQDPGGGPVWSAQAVSALPGMLEHSGGVCGPLPTPEGPQAPQTGALPEGALRPAEPPARPRPSPAPSSQALEDPSQASHPAEETKRPASPESSCTGTPPKGAGRPPPGGSPGRTPRGAGAPPPSRPAGPREGPARPPTRAGRPGGPGRARGCDPAGPGGSGPARRRARGPHSPPRSLRMPMVPPV
ncbi:basic proline-rich protein-like [Hippopotamus amphibius kiboko]|uniref:basic proline-rich protein-like n=1 Tax=Hippopotamus amphibius kiboko TaxID=575201 RepID=UPI0025933BD3|nr:basic proline-rich protein-like [Hippopotamus amphibius kiboko]